MKIQQPTKNQTVRTAQQGFTLVEMLLVLVILATLAAIVYPKVMGRSEQARVTAAKTQIASFKLPGEAGCKLLDEKAVEKVVQLARSAIGLRGVKEKRSPHAINKARR